MPFEDELCTGEIKLDYKDPWADILKCKDLQPTKPREETELERCQRIALNIYNIHKEESLEVARRLERYMAQMGCKCKIYLTFQKPPCGKKKNLYLSCTSGGDPVMVTQENSTGFGTTETAAGTGAAAANTGAPANATGKTSYRYGGSAALRGIPYY
jgi:hypothetical protein